MGKLLENLQIIALIVENRKHFLTIIPQPKFEMIDK